MFSLDLVSALGVIIRR
jgi:uncharacterized membrane protein YcaP (DUF421 family)